MHLNLDDPISRTSLTSTAFDVETKTAFFVASNLGFIGLGKEIANVIKDACIGRWIGTRSATNRALINVDQAIDMLNPLNRLVFPWFFRIAVELLSDGFFQDAIDQGRFSRTGRPLDCEELPFVYFQINAIEGCRLHTFRTVRHDRAADRNSDTGFRIKPSGFLPPLYAVCGGSRFHQAGAWRQMGSRCCRFPVCDRLAGSFCRTWLCTAVWHVKKNIK